MIKWNKIKYIDCLDEKEGLPSLPDKSIDICLTDPPWGIDLKKEGKINYKDDYTFNWNERWFNEILRVCKGLVLIAGWNHHFDWIRFKKPNYYPKYWYRTNTVSIIKLEPILFYGKIKRYNFMRQIFEINYNLKKLKIEDLNHPSPKYAPFLHYILDKLKPKNVLDPFMGSGATAEVCIKLGIPYIGYEINPVYKQDMDLRRSKGMSCINSSINISYWLKKP